MTNRTNEEVYEKVVEVKTLLAGRQDTWVTKAHFDKAIQGLGKPAGGKGADKKKEEDKPSLVEQLSPLTGLSDVIGNLLKKEWLPATVAVVATLGFNKLLNWDVLGKKLLDRIGLELKSEKFLGVGSAPKPGGQVAVSQIDVDRLKGMRSAAVALTRSLSDLHKEAKQAASQIA
ncbi:hypothetical protein [Streptomyces sp. Ag109_G2-15]|uniref:hypothetical protein n=1 Tax=Streptomyces sp. Ag109_G2-15 TaxID=1938850 RepID=UPI000BD30482|nr:hypothetical protein [Streptomyces sp. Ag109_G2-15]SOD84971.1 hypothetical protein SAMN06272765_2367 [Streptomyces sp. Ag109_G2-15]